MRGRAGEGGRPASSATEATLQAGSANGEKSASDALPNLLPPSLTLPRKAGGDDTILAALDPDQRAAASQVDGPLLVVAGPGSGKTRMLTHRIAHLVAERGVPPESCLAITFTRRAATEMRERLAHLIPAQATAVPVHTFHSLGLTILRESPEAARLQPGFGIAGEAERIAALAEALDVSERKAATLLRNISKTKRGGAQPIDDKLATAIAAYSTLHGRAQLGRFRRSRRCSPPRR